MSYAVLDASSASGSPTDLYKFVYGQNTFRYCSVDGGVRTFEKTIAGVNEQFTAATLSYSSTEATEDLARASVEITVPRTNPVATLFIAAPPEGEISISIWRIHVTDETNDYFTVFKGRVMSCTFRDDDTATLFCEALSTSMRRPGLRMVYDSQCVYELFGHGCNLSRALWEEPGTISEINGNVVTIQAASAFADQYFRSGVLACGSVRRMIVSHVGTSLTLMHPIPVDLQGQSCILTPGCSHTRTECGSKFNNAINHGGFSWIPLKSPYSGDTVFW